MMTWTAARTIGRVNISRKSITISKANAPENYPTALATAQIHMTRRYRRRERTGNEKAQDKNVLCFFVQADIALLPLSHTMENSLFFAISVKQIFDTLGTDIPSFKVDDI